MFTEYEKYVNSTIIKEEDEKYMKLKMDIYDKSVKDFTSKKDDNKNTVDKEAVNKQLDDSKNKIAMLKADLDKKHEYMQKLLAEPNILNDENIKKSAESLKKDIETDSKKYDEMVKLFDDQKNKLNKS